MTQLLLIGDGPNSPAIAAAGPFVPDTRPLVACDKCGCLSFEDKPIHDGQSTRRSCSFCGRFMGFPVWYGVEELPAPARPLPLAAELEAA